MDKQIENFVGIYTNAFDSQYCDDVISEFHKMEELGYTKSRQQLNDQEKTHKDDAAYFSGHHYSIEASMSEGMHSLIGTKFNETFWQECYAHYAENYAVLKESGSHAIWGNKVQRTNVGQGYHVWHYESSNRDSCQRLLTYILYLNDVEEGGETELLYYSKRFKPTKGTLLLFPAGYTHTHRGNPPLSNDKYVVTGWVEF